MALTPLSKSILFLLLTLALFLPLTFGTSYPIVKSYILQEISRPVPKVCTSSKSPETDFQALELLPRTLTFCGANKMDSMAYNVTLC